MKSVLASSVALTVASLSMFVTASVSAQKPGDAVFAMTNSASANEIVAFSSVLGHYIEVQHYATNGRGSGGVTDPLQSQGSLVLTQDGKFLLAANAGSGTVSVFAVNGTSLALRDQVPSGGSEPLSITEQAGRVYVLNGAGAGNIVSFQLSAEGRLTALRQPTTYLSGAGAGGASLAISPDGKYLVAIERTTNSIDVFPIQGNTLGSIQTTVDKSPGSFSASFAPNGTLLVSEAGPANTVGQATISSYNLSGNGTLMAVSQGVPTFGSANCWNVVTPDGRFVYVSNAASSTISGFAIGKAGTLTAIGSTIVGTNAQGSTNLDITTSADGKFLFSLNSGTGTISVFAIKGNGTLELKGELDGLPSSAGINGIAAL